MITDNETSSLPVLDRIRTIIKQKCGSQKKFCELTGLNEKTLSSMLQRNSSPNYEFLSTLISAFSDINVDWLITGRGEMIQQEIPNVQLTDSNKYLVERFEAVLNELHDIKDEVKKKDEIIAKQQAEIEKLKSKQIYTIEKKDGDIGNIAAEPSSELKG